MPPKQNEHRTQSHGESQGRAHGKNACSGKGSSVRHHHLRLGEWPHPSCQIHQCRRPRCHTSRHPKAAEACTFTGSGEHHLFQPLASLPSATFHVLVAEYKSRGSHRLSPEPRNVTVRLRPGAVPFLSKPLPYKLPQNVGRVVPKSRGVLDE